MPTLATAAKGSLNIMLEPNPGEQLALATTAIAATLTGIAAPTGSTGVRYHIKITNWTTSGTLTITGTGTPASTETVTIPAPTAQQTQSAQLASFEYVSVNAYTAITNFTTTGATGGTITAWAINAGKYQLSGTMKSKRTPKTYSPNEHNTLIERDKKILQLVNNTSIDEVKQDCYADLSLWWAYMVLGAPTVATIPASPTSLFAATPLSSSQTLTTQPTVPGMKLILTITSFTVAGTVTINGTSYGKSVSETISVTAAGTYYSSNVYTAVSTITNATTAATMAVDGVYGWQLTFGSGANLYTAAIEWYDGTGSWTHPFSFAESGTFDAKVQSEVTISIKGKAQDLLPIGDRATSPLAGTNRLAAIGPLLTDLPIVGWQAYVYLDAITGSPLTTQDSNIQELKIDIKTPQEEHWTFTNSQNFNRAYAQKRECTVDATLDFRDLSYWEQFRQNLKQYLSVQFLGQHIGNVSATPYFKSWTWTFPVRSDGDFDVTSDPAKGAVEAKAKWRAEYDAVLGGAYKLVIITQTPPTYAS